MTETTNRKHISRRRLHGIHGTKTVAPMWSQLGENAPPLSMLLEFAVGTGRDRIHLCGSLDKMTKEYCDEPIKAGWEFAAPFTFKHRAPWYRKADGPSFPDVKVKLISHRESWFPGCERTDVAIDAWGALTAEWERTTSLPLLSSPSKTGQALLWENLPRDKSGVPVQFPALPEDVEKIVRANSPQHRIENLPALNYWGDGGAWFQYDGRWMYAALATLDRLPIGEPREVAAVSFNGCQYLPGWYYVQVVVPETWNHIGIVPMLTADGWTWPNEPGLIFETWASEPELTLAVQKGWRVTVRNGYVFDKGRPLDEWAQKLIAMRKRLQDAATDEHIKSAPPSVTAPLNHFDFAASAVRQILNHAIGSLHARGYERELFVSDDNWRMWRRENAAWFDAHNAERVDGGWSVSHWVPDNSPLSINMPNWSATIWALERARVAQWALKCDGKEGRPGPETLVKINGDAIYATTELPFEDTGKVGQLRRKA